MVRRLATAGGACTPSVSLLSYEKRRGRVMHAQPGAVAGSARLPAALRLNAAGARHLDRCLFSGRATSGCRCPSPRRLRPAQQPRRLPRGQHVQRGRSSTSAQGTEPPACQLTPAPRCVRTAGRLIAPLLDVGRRGRYAFSYPQSWHCSDGGPYSSPQQGRRRSGGYRSRGPRSQRAIWRAIDTDGLNCAQRPPGQPRLEAGQASAGSIRSALRNSKKTRLV